MYCSFENKKSDRARVLMFSQKNIRANLLFRCAFYEFEDLVCKFDVVDLLAPKPGKWYQYGYRIANRISQDSDLILNPGVPKIKVKGYYYIFFAAFMLPFDL